MKTISFSTVKFADLASIIDIRPDVDDAIFADWFGGLAEIS